jgi:hypothetical protein
VSDLTIQASLNAGEWSPKLFARVDLQKYRSGAALLENWFVDYRGGASTRPGTRYILQCYKSATPVRLISFQASFDVGYVLEFGDQYIRFFFDGAPVLETAIAITNVTQANPAVATIPGNTYVVGEWIFITGVNGMTQLNGKFFRVNAVAGPNITLGNISDSSNLNSIGYGAYVSGGTSSRVYTINSPYAAADLALVKFAQNVNQLILCHPDYQPYVLTLIGPTNWTLLPITFGTTAGAPVINAAGSNFPTPGPSCNVAYVATSIDANGQESVPSPQFNIFGISDMRVTNGTITLGWTVVPGAVAYNVYKAVPSYVAAVPPGSTFGYIGTVTSTGFADSNIAPDFSQTPPIARNPFEGAGVESVAITNAGVYTAVPSVSIIGASTITASVAAVLQVQGTPTVGAGGTGYVVGDTVLFTNNVVLVVATLAGSAVASWRPITFTGSNPGAVTSGGTPANPVAQVSTSGVGTGATANLVWGVGQVLVLNSGSGYTVTPTVSFSSGAATATVTLAANSNGYPSVPGFFQQRLVLAAPRGAPQTFYMSQPGAYFNYNISQISQADDAITGTLVSGQLNTIRAMISQPTGLLMFTDRNSWLINGGTGQGSAVSPSALVANAQSFNGVSNVPLIIANFDVLYVQAKGSIVRDSAYNIYANVYTGTDISAISSHLFYGFTVDEWAWAEEPFKIAWGVRSDGAALALTFLKEQEFIGWTHSSTLGNFQSVTTVVETTVDAGEIDAVYWVVERTINGNVLKYIERFAERVFANGVEDAWCVDCGIGYNGVPATSFSGAEFLAGETVTGLADGVVIPPFVMPISGDFVLASPASKVSVGLGFTCKLQTLPLDMGEPTIQGKVKKINAVDTRVSETLGLYIGSEPANITPMKDLIVGNVSTMLTGQNSQIITDLVDGDARTFLDPRFTVPGQYYIEQNLPLPATVLGLISDYTVGDVGNRGR